MHFIRVRRLLGAAALVGAGALTLAGCGGGSADTTADKPSTSASTTTATASATATASPSGTGPETSPGGTPTPAVVPLRDLTGASIGKAIAAAESGGLRYAVYLQGTGLSRDGGGQRASSWAADEEVCDQIDGSDGASYDVAFTVPRNGRDCAGRLLHTPEPTREAGTGSGSGSSASGGSTGGGGGTACAITSPAGNCYADGQFCANRHHGLSTYGRGGEYLTCSQDGSGRWRWSDGAVG
ncbi:hypothetical protein SUDANB58_02622 [Streptomyces sp. enrichment culture]|uniref:hypothetical protein n=1 Tax=Streptomyces sp. enrichment culture TaxID=1795815 RepID=UPI003F557029